VTGKEIRVETGFLGFSLDDICDLAVCDGKDPALLDVRDL
jgi:hypothetical protein